MGEKEALPVYMDPIEFSQLLAIVNTLGPRRCLEWGSGGSTRALLEHCPFIEQYVSVEHDGEWHEQVKQRVEDPRLELNHVPPDKPMSPGKHKHEEVVAWDASGEVDPGVMAHYVAFPATLNQQFDFVLVDGRARCFCLKAGWELLRPGGVIVLHDAQRTQYHDAVRALGRAVFLEPWKQGQLCLVRKD
jgi:predicted O-methyltransferase YrrM